MIHLSRVALLLLAAASLGAADFTGGIQLGPAFPMSDFKTVTNTSVGGAVNFFFLWDLDGGHMVRARLDGTSASGTAADAPVKVSVGVGSLGADYLYYFEGSRNHGPYAGAGAAYASTSAKLELQVPGLKISTFSDTYSSAIFGLYGGYQFTPHWSAEVAYRYTRISPNQTGLDSSVNLPSLAVMAGYTF